MIILQADKLTVSYDDIVIEDVSFTVEKGDFISIVGENGSGKTTLIKAVLGLIRADRGSIRRADNVRFGYVPQKLSIKHGFPASVSEIVYSGIRTSLPFYRKSEKMRALDNMALLHIEDLKGKSFSALSGGQQQRVLIARALTASDDVLILDEPVTGLDPLVSAELYALLKDLNQKRNITVIMVSHDMHTAIGCANKILHLDKTVHFFGAPSDYICSECGKRFLGGEENA